MPRPLIALAALGSLALLLGAFGFQHLGGLAPCKMCFWQRWPHAAAILVGAIALIWGRQALAWLGALAMAITAGIGGYHAGVEWKWWPGPSSCSGGGADLSQATGADLLSLDAPASVVMCDEIVWQMLGLSMAGWNMVASLILMGLWIMATRGRTTA